MCPVCDNPLPAGARFCPSCGALVAALGGTEERKFVTVLFADLVDSTGLSQRLDPERARDLQGGFFEAVTEELQALRGKPEKFIGDAVMAVFGLPHVHEDDALRAVRSGLAIRARTQRLGRAAGLTEPLEVRIGIETGEAATGQGPAGQMLVTGPVVNVASRLQAAARPDEVLAGHTTHALTTTAVSYGRRRRVRARGFDEPLPAFPVEGLTNRSARRTIPFVGRASEQAILNQSLAMATTSRRPVLVTVVGESGIGKSRLADETAAGVSAGVNVLRGRGRSHSDTATFAAVATIVGDLAGIEGGEVHDEIRRRLRALAEQCCRPEDAARVAERLGLVFGLAERPEESAFVQDVQSGFIALIDGLAREQPVLLIFEDVHTFDGPMLDLVERLGSRSRRGPRQALVLALARPELLELRPTWGGSGGNAVLLHLEPLSLDESIKLVRQAGGGMIADNEAGVIAARAGGNPYFIIETTGMIVAGDGGASARAALPPTVQAVVSSRLDALPHRLRDLARRVSIPRYGFDLEDLALLDPEGTVAELQQLEEAEILVHETTPRGTLLWRLRHATLRDVAYASLPKRERVRLHTVFAESLLEAGHKSWGADHLEMAALASLDLDPSDRAAPERAADALLVAGDRARRRTESRSAVGFYQRALALAGPPEQWAVREARALAGAGEAHYWLGEYPAATEALNRAVAIGESKGDAFTLALALRFLGDIAINVEADVDKAELLLDRSLVAAEELGDSWAVVRTLLFAGWVPWTRGRFEAAEELWRKALAMADPMDLWARVRALTALSVNRTEYPDHATALALAEEASSLAEEAGDQFSIAVTAVQKGRVLEDLGRQQEALRWLDRGIAIFEELGARWELADARAERGITKRDLGLLDEAEDDLRQALRISDELGERQLAGWTWRALARVAERRGDQAEAMERLRRSREAEARGPH
jgi:class 3 adenylate cyclase/tetratricopeptide (TPR) repeat protein